MALTTYTDTSGPWVNGVTPLSAANLNAMRAFLIASGAMWDSNISVDGSGMQTVLSQRINTVGVVLTGGTSGTATLYQVERGTWKYVMIQFANFRTAAVAQTLALPVPFTNGGRVWSGETGTTAQNNGFSLLASGVAQTINAWISLAATGGSAAPITVMYTRSIGEVETAFDSISFQASSTIGHGGYIFIEGI